MFKGHQLVKLVNDHWVFDITDYTGYKVSINKSGEATSYKEAFRAYRDDDEICIEKTIPVPIKIIKETMIVINSIEEKALVKGDKHRNG